MIAATTRSVGEGVYLLAVFLASWSQEIQRNLDLSLPPFLAIESGGLKATVSSYILEFADTVADAGELKQDAISRILIILKMKEYLLFY